MGDINVLGRWGENCWENGKPTDGDQVSTGLYCVLVCKQNHRWQYNEDLTGSE